MLVFSAPTIRLANVQIGMHPEGVFLMRFMPHPTDPERFFYDTMTLIRPVDDPNYTVPGWMGLPEDTDLTGEIRPDTEYVADGESANLGLVLDQDSALLPVVQEGIRSRGFEGAMLSEQEQRILQNVLSELRGLYIHTSGFKA